jgi:hypothetical protein
MLPVHALVIHFQDAGFAYFAYFARNQDFDIEGSLVKAAGTHAFGYINNFACLFYELHSKRNRDVTGIAAFHNVMYD